MLVGTCLLGHVLTTLAVQPAAAGPETGERPPRRHHDTLLYTNYVGLGGGARWGRRTVTVEDVSGDMSGARRRRRTCPEGQAAAGARRQKITG